MDRQPMVWDQELLSAVGISEDQLPKIDVEDEPTPGLIVEWADRWPALANAKWFLPIGDGVANNFGSTCLSPEHVALMMATSGAVRIVTTDAMEQIPDGLWCYRIDKDRWLLGGALSSAGNVIDWLLKSLDINSANLANDLAGSSPDSHWIDHIAISRR